MILLDYLLLIFVVSLINTIPAFMPETWVVLSFFHLHYHLSYIAVVILGSLFGTLGRVLLAILTKNHFYKIIPKKLLTNYHDLGNIFTGNKPPTFSLLLAYTFIPLPENQIFIAAGLANIDLKLLAISSTIRNLIVYGFWVKTSSVAINSLQGIFSGHTQILPVVINLVSFSLLIVIGFIPWGKIIKKKS